MTLSPRVSALLLLVAAIAIFVIGALWRNDETVAAILFSVASALLSVSMALLIVNHYFLKSEKKLAAEPMFRMIGENVAYLNNELIVEACRVRFGHDTFESLLDSYKKRNGDPKAFSAEQRKALYELIRENRSELQRVHSDLSVQLQELTLLMGWEFDPNIVRAAINARINFTQFSRLKWDDSIQDQLAAVETFLDSGASANAVLDGLAKHMGLSVADYRTESRQ